MNMTVEDAISELIRGTAFINNEFTDSYILAVNIAIRALQIFKNADIISKNDANKYISTRLLETALNNVGYECNASDTYLDIVDNRLSTWIAEIPCVRL